MIVLDTSVLVDALLPRLERRHEAALSLMRILSEKRGREEGIDAYFFIEEADVVLDKVRRL